MISCFGYTNSRYFDPKTEDQRISRINVYENIVTVYSGRDNEGSSDENPPSTKNQQTRGENVSGLTSHAAETHGHVSFSG